MTFNELKKFIQKDMKMSHIYQPLLIKSLIESGGSATLRQLAIEFLSKDESQIIYYESILKKMPIKILSKHNVIERDEELVKLKAKKLSIEQKAELKMLCEQKMQEYISSRGLSIWDYRLLDNNLVPDSLRYQLLKEARGRCALCGATKEDRPLDIDHIIPRSKKGKTEYENLQVLCSKCNRTKGNKDKTDFRKIVEDDLKQGCLFCELPPNRVIDENEHVLVVLSHYPVTEGHTLFIPKRHFADYFDITKAEEDSVNKLIRIRRNKLLNNDNTIEGFNVGVNAGEVAGQTIMHCHIHLIPRRNGDTENPRGGVRGVIPDKMSY